MVLYVSSVLLPVDPMPFIFPNAKTSTTPCFLDTDSSLILSVFLLTLIFYFRPLNSDIPLLLPTYLHHFTISWTTLSNKLLLQYTSFLYLISVKIYMLVIGLECFFSSMYISLSQPCIWCAFLTLVKKNNLVNISPQTASFFNRCNPVTPYLSYNQQNFLSSCYPRTHLFFHGICYCIIFFPWKAGWPMAKIWLQKKAHGTAALQKVDRSSL